jgi:hypothetical protein
MAYLTSSLFSTTHLAINNAFQLRFGVREISIRKDFKKRFYHTNPIIECHAGAKAGHLEILLFRTWLIVFSKACVF